MNNEQSFVLRLIPPFTQQNNLFLMNEHPKTLIHKGNMKKR